MFVSIEGVAWVPGAGLSTGVVRWPWCMYLFQVRVFAWFHGLFDAFYYGTAIVCPEAGVALSNFFWCFFDFHSYQRRFCSPPWARLCTGRCLALLRGDGFIAFVWSSLVWVLDYCLQASGVHLCGVIVVFAAFFHGGVPISCLCFGSGSTALVNGKGAVCRIYKRR